MHEYQLPYESISILDKFIHWTQKNCYKVTCKWGVNEESLNYIAFICIILNCKSLTSMCIFSLKIVKNDGNHNLGQASQYNNKRESTHLKYHIYNLFARKKLKIHWHWPSFFLFIHSCWIIVLKQFPKPAIQVFTS